MASTQSHKNGEASIELKSKSDGRTYNIFGKKKRRVPTGAAFQVKLPRLSRDRGSIVHSRNSTYDDEKFLVGLPIMLSGKQTDPGFVPGNDDDNWSELERDSFLLGFYIFERDFREVKRFVGSKEMGAVLSYYYAKFHHSPEFKKWLACRKIRDDRGIFFGREMFLGRKQNKLLSRILPRVATDQQEGLLKVSEAFKDRKMSLENYVLCLKGIVGINILTEAIGITKQDAVTGILTSQSLNDVKDGDALIRSIRQNDPVSDPDDNLQEVEIQSRMMLGDWSNTEVDISQVSIENPEIRIWVDLNLPTSDYDDGKEKNDDQEKKQLHPTTAVEEQLNTNSTRRSTRARPLTTRAIEAVAHGYMNRNLRRKTNEANSK